MPIPLRRSASQRQPKGFHVLRSSFGRRMNKFFRPAALPSGPPSFQKSRTKLSEDGLQRLHSTQTRFPAVGQAAPEADAQTAAPRSIRLCNRHRRDRCRLGRRGLRRGIVENFEEVVERRGDCLIDLASMAYLNTCYGGNLGVLWVDAHPDVLTPKDFAHGNAQVLGALLGKGDSDL